tara:strand:- start:812 stop:1462 length:651 start_codon:yes stop_codon:yes gene_type:complete
VQAAEIGLRNPLQKSHLQNCYKDEFYNMKIGYARVSTSNQNADGQIDALTVAGCEKIFIEKKSAVKARPVLAELLDYARPGDALVVQKFDRLARSVQTLLGITKELEDKGIELISLSDQIDTTTPHGKAFFTIAGAFAELERNLIIARTKAGLEAARKRGKVGGRPAKLTKSQIEQAIILKETETLTKIAESFHVHVSTVSRGIRDYEAKKDNQAK